MAEEKVYGPEVIEENPYPVDPGQTGTTSQKSSDGTYSPATVKAADLPKKKIAQELISTSLNTLSRKILGVYQFVKQGAIQIGEFIENVSGEIKISPDGIVAKNKKGETTFGIDGKTGDATFKGVVQGGDFVIADEKGITSLGNFTSGVANKTDAQIISSSSYVDVTGLSVTFELKRKANVLFLTNITGNHEEYDGALSFQLVIDDVAQAKKAVIAGIQAYGALAVTPTDVGITISMNHLVQLEAGTHTVKIQARNNNANNYAHIEYSANYGGANSLVYLVLGS